MERESRMSRLRRAQYWEKEVSNAGFEKGLNSGTDVVFFFDSDSWSV